MKRNKSGISLIVLVITIIVMIILAAAVVITLSNSGIIDKANQAVEGSDLQQVQHAATLIWADSYLDSVNNMNESYIRNELEENGINAEKYDITLTENGVTVGQKVVVPEEWKDSIREITADGVPIPKGFVKSPYVNEGAKNTGLVIYALTEQEIIDGVTDIVEKDSEHKQSLENRNQFVWVPVDGDKFEELFVREYFTALSNQLGQGTWEIVLGNDNMPNPNKNTAKDYVSTATLEESIAMYASVKKYGGFYIARYEVGAKDAENLTIGDISGYIGRGELSVTMAKYPYVAAPWGTSMRNEALSGGAVTISREFYPASGTTYGVVSTLTYGVQWDRTQAWWTEANSNLNFMADNYGVYKDTKINASDVNKNAKYSVCTTTYIEEELKELWDYSEWKPLISKNESGEWLLTTGAYKSASILNIYDMRGNAFEWTMEGKNTDMRVARGGYFGGEGRIGTPDGTDRNFLFPSSGGWYTGFRPSLYIK